MSVQDYILSSYYDHKVAFISWEIVLSAKQVLFHQQSDQHNLGTLFISLVGIGQEEYTFPQIQQMKTVYKYSTHFNCVIFIIKVTKDKWGKIYRQRVFCLLKTLIIVVMYFYI